jgi:histidyl-tRNA synthetase
MRSFELLTLYAPTQPKVIGKLLPQLKKAGDAQIAVIVGDDELKNGTVKLKWLTADASRKEQDVPRVGFETVIVNALAELRNAVASPAPTSTATSTTTPAAASSSSTQ